MKAKYFFNGLAAIALLGLPMLASAQDYDDDIYYNPSKSKKTTTTTKKTTQQTYVSQSDYAAADTYYFNSGDTRDIDEYNRRSAYAVDTTGVSSDSTAMGEFGYTRRIERFHNPDVVVNSGDADLIDYYYSTEASSDNGTTVNIYVYDTPYYYGSWRSPYYRFGRWGWYDPWYWDVFSPAWSLSWGWYDPWYSWSWGWGPSFGWGWGGLGWGHSWCGHGWGGGMAMRPVTPSAGRAHANVGSSMNSVRRASAGTSFSGQARPGSLSARRFGSSSSLSSSRNNGSSSVQATTTGRGRFGSSNNSSDNSSRRSNSYNNSNNSYNSSSSSSRGSGSSWGSGSRGGGGGSSHSGGGGGGGRGRR